MVPAYLATGGRTAPGRQGLDRLTVLAASGPGTADDPADGAAADLGPEHHALHDLLRAGSLTLVEAAAHLRLPVSATGFLAADLVDAGRLHTRTPIPRAQQIDHALVERLLVGLRTLR